MKAKRLWYLFIFVLIGMGGLGSFGAADVSAAETFNWRISSSFAPGDLSADLLPEFAKRVTEASKGRLTMRSFYEGDIVGSEQTLDAVGKGVFEMAELSSSMYVGKYPVLVAQGPVPFVQTGDFDKIVNFALKGEMAKLMENQFDTLGLKIVGYVPFGPYPAICSRVPIRSYNDFKGKKIRASGSIVTIFNAIGASAGYIPGGEVYLALQLGTYDAAVYSVDCVDGMKWREVMKYYVLPYFCDEYFGQVLVNKAAWAKLPDDLKKIVNDTQNWYYNANHVAIDKMKNANITRAKEWGYEVITLPPADVAKIKQVAIDKVWPGLAKDKDSTKYVEIIKKYHGVK
jgi:TRAP-type C4-dicarboxylate transport system substrate-binding protein